MDFPPRAFTFTSKTQSHVYTHSRTHVAEAPKPLQGLVKALLFSMALLPATLHAQTTIELAVGNESGCDLKFYPYFREIGLACDPGELTAGEPCSIPDGQVTVCTFWVPEDHFICKYDFWNEADATQQHLIINFPCTQNEMNWIGLPICEEGQFVDVNMSDCEQIKFVEQ